MRHRRRRIIRAEATLPPRPLAGDPSLRAGGRLYARRYSSLVENAGIRHPDFMLAEVFGASYDGGCRIRIDKGPPPEAASNFPLLRSRERLFSQQGHPGASLGSPPGRIAAS